MTQMENTSKRKLSEAEIQALEACTGLPSEKISKDVRDGLIAQAQQEAVINDPNAGKARRK
jgi:hypothetical protein